MIAEPHVRRRGQEVADREHGVVEHLAPGGERAELVADPPAEQDRRHQQRERVRERVEDQLGDGRRELADAMPEVAVEERAPEVQVLLPERHVEPEGVRVVAASAASVAPRAANSCATAWRATGSPGMKRGITQSTVTATKKVRSVDQDLPCEVAASTSSSAGVARRERATPLPSRRRERCRGGHRRGAAARTAWQASGG